MPDWVSVTWSNEKGDSGNGYINKSNFSDTPIVVNPTQTQQQNSSVKQSSPTTIEQNSSAKQDLVSIIKQWRPSIAHIECAWKFINSDGSIDYNKSRVLGGSGFLGSIGGKVVVYTNKHVITLNDYVDISDPTSGMPPSKCLIQFPDNSNIYNAYYTRFTNDADATFLFSHDYDFGAIKIANPDSYLNDLNNIQKAFYYCNDRVSLGENIVVLGYPGIGATNDITATEGIISGYDGDYYITSAKIEHGNSGGIAILTQHNCAVGIPTFVEIGSVESLGRILDMKKVFGY